MQGRGASSAERVSADTQRRDATGMVVTGNGDAVGRMPFIGDARGPPGPSM